MSEDRKRELEPQSPTEGQGAGRTAASELTQDERFKTFFTTSVIEVPEQMLKVDKERDSVEEPPEPRGGFSRWLRGLFRGGEDETDEENAEEGAEDSDVLIPGRTRQAAPAETGEVPLMPGSRETGERPLAAGTGETGEIPLMPQTEETGEIPLMPQTEETGEIPLMPQAEEAGEIPLMPQAAAAEKPAPIKEPETPPASPAPAEAPDKQPESSDTAPGPAPKMPRAAAPHVTIGQLLEKIDETQAVLRPSEPAARAAAENAAVPQAAKPEETAPVQPQAAEPEETAPVQPQAAEPEVTAPAQPQAAEPEETAPVQPQAAELEESVPVQPQAAKPEETAPAQPQAAEPEETAPVQPQAAEPEEILPETAAPAESPENSLDNAAMAARIAQAVKQKETAEFAAAPAGEEPSAGMPRADDGGAPEEPAESTGETGEIPLAQAPSGTGRIVDSGRILIDAAAAAVEEKNEWELPRDGAGRFGRRLLNSFLGRGGEPDAGNPISDAEEEAAPATPAEKEYTDPEDAERILAMLESETAAGTLRCALSGVLAAALLVLGILGQGPNPIAVLDPAVDPMLWLGLNMVLLALAMGINWNALQEGLTALLPHHTPSAAALPAVTSIAAMLQAVVCLLMQKSASVGEVTLFACAAAVMIFADALGRRLSQAAVRDGFRQMTGGVKTVTAYRLQDQRLTAELCEGMEEEEPILMLSRPSALLKRFLGQSAAPHRSDAQATDFARILGAVAVLCMLISLVLRHDVVKSVSLLAGILCMGAPFSAMLVRAVPALLMQRAAGHVGAVIPGWPGMEQMSDVDMLQVDAEELFPPACAHLYGIKTIQKERIDRAILYATSILIEGCGTLSGLFCNMIENNSALLYPVKDLEKRPGQGFVGWCDSCRVLLGTRAMMEAEGIALPALDYENRYTQNGDRNLLYLAVSGKLYAMFLFGYHGTKKVARTLGVLRRENIRLLVRSDDPTLTAARIEEIYRLRPGFVKVLGAEECARLEPAMTYLPAMDGCMVHLPDFASMVGGLRAAASAERAERSACTVQMVAVTVSILLGILFTMTNYLYNTSMFYPLLYQLAWSAISVAITLTKMY